MMMKGWRRLAGGGILLRELRGIRQEVKELRLAIQGFADRAFPPPPAVRPPDSVTPEDPLVEVSYVDNLQQAEWMDIELRLTQARGAPPSEDDILAEYERRHPRQPAS